MKTITFYYYFIDRMIITGPLNCGLLQKLISNRIKSTLTTVLRKVFFIITTILKLIKDLRSFKINYLITTV